MALSVEESQKVKKPLTTKQSAVIAIVSLVMGLLIFFIAYIGMLDKTGLGKFNPTILSWMVNHRQADITIVAQIVTTIANPFIFAAIIGVIAIIWVVFKREIWRPVLLAGGVAVAGLVSMGLKAVIMDARPPQSDMIPMFETDFSFPSGHTIGIAVFLFVIGYLIYSRHFSALRFWTWIIVALLGTGIIALSRLYLGYHWLTDVVASLGLGLVILAVVIVIDLIAAKLNKTKI